MALTVSLLIVCERLCSRYVEYLLSTWSKYRLSVGAVVLKQANQPF